MTLPQIIMLNHAAWVNSKRMEIRSGNNEGQEETDPRVYRGKKLSELDSKDMRNYYSDFGA